MSKPSLRPQRTDAFYMKDVLQAAFNARIGLVMVTIIVIALVIAIVVIASRPQRVVVIDSGTGRTFAASSQQGVTGNLIDRQVCYYSARAVEDFFNYDFQTITRARQSVYDLAGAEFRKKLGDKYVDNEDVRKCVEDKAQSIFQWEILPRVTMRNDPYYSAFATFQRVVRVNGVTKELKKFNVKIDFGRLNENVEYSKRPHALVLLNITVLNEGSMELNEQLNKVVR